ncbi:MAG: dihydrodipicolinate synthase family protein, partial [Firmicutes bacterium]|nr:dihydrodipicolinate synthase family protein [Bacillota bacterium]
NLESETVAKLAEHKNISALKEASGNISQILETARLTKDKIDLFSGDDNLAYTMLSLGGKGVISVASNIIPSYMSEMCSAYFNKDINKSMEMQLKILPLIKILFSEVNPIPVKCASRLMGIIADDHMRLPLTRFTKPEEMKKVLSELNFM